MSAESKSEDRVQELETRLLEEQKLRSVTRRIHALPLDEVLLQVKEDVQNLLQCQRVTIYAKDLHKEEIFSKIKDGTEIKEIRLPINPTSIAGWVAFRRKGLRIKNVYDAAESKSIDPNLRFDSEWDRKTGFKTKQILAVPVLRDGKIHGVLQAINTHDGNPFNELHEAQLLELADSLAVAFHNQQRLNIRASKFDHLLRNALVSQDTLDQAQSLGQKEGFSTEHALITKFKVPPSEIATSLSEFYRTEYVPYQPGTPIPVDLLQEFTVDFLKHHQFVPHSEEEGAAVILMSNPRNLTLLDDLQRKLNRKLKVKVATREDVISFVSEFFGEKTATEVDPGIIGDIVGELEQEEDAQSKKKKEDEEGKEEVKEDDTGIVKLVNQIIEQAHAKGASDIHIEPYMDGDCLVRLRVDGACIEYAKLPKRFWRAVISRVKIMANLDIAERRLPQDGKIRFRDFGSKNIELRVATVPTTGGREDVVMRILAASEPLPLQKLGMLPHNHERFEKVIQEPYGIILCVGPTGSGKTTTLHSALGNLNKPDVKIWTAEDPVEITQPGLRQVQVQPKIGFTFERALRAFLRLDPDIIMIGEMRDAETAGAAVEASLTGHLVMSTLHTNNAPETITRLLDLDLDPYTFGDSLLAILAQRLMRGLCKACVKMHSPTTEEWELLRHEYGDVAGFDRIDRKRDDVQLGDTVGCTKCNQTGYKGRLGIHELLVVDDEIRQLVYRKAKSADIRDVAIRKGMTMLKQDGIQKILMGLTDLKEVRSVCVK